MWPQNPRPPVVTSRGGRGSTPVAPADNRERSPRGLLTMTHAMGYGRCRSRSASRPAEDEAGRAEVSRGRRIAGASPFGVPCRNHGRMLSGRALMVSPGRRGWVAAETSMSHATVACGPGGGTPVSRVETTGGLEALGRCAFLLRRKAKALTAKSAPAPVGAGLQSGALTRPARTPRRRRRETSREPCRTGERAV